MLYFRSHQVDHVRHARARGIKSIVGIGSWDHLTTKGLIHEVPDRVLVWNEAQKQEAIDLHGVPGDRVIVTGSQAYDHWFDMRPSVDREAFCARVGLDAARPILLYLCSSSFIAPYEVGFVRSWMAAIRSSTDPWVRSVGLLVRPHPQNAEQWQTVDLPSEFENVSVWPKAGMNPIGGAARHEYFDSMYHAEAVVGVNTSGMIESGIIGRPVYAVQVTEFAATQDGTLHFQHLKNVDGGLLHLAGTLDEHVAQLARLPADGEAEPAAGAAVHQAIRAPARPRRGRRRRAWWRQSKSLPPRPALAPVAAPAGARSMRILLAPVAVIADAHHDGPGEADVPSSSTGLRPVRLVARAVYSRVVYGLRFLRRLPRLVLRLAAGALRLFVLRPARWARHRAKTAPPRLPGVAQGRNTRDGRDAVTMRLLFSMRHLGSLRMYESVLRQLAARGHSIDILAKRRDVPGTPRRRKPCCPTCRRSGGSGRTRTSRRGSDRWRRAPHLARLPALLAGRATPARRDWPSVSPSGCPPCCCGCRTGRVFRSPRGLRLLAAALRKVEQALPRQPELDALMREHRPDVVLLTPLLRLGSSQIEVLRSARAHGARTGLCVASWDHLSSKARIAELPDRVFVWNETQKHEAVELHGVPEASVVVTGAQCYDEWYERRTGADARGVLRHAGPARRPAAHSLRLLGVLLATAHRGRVRAPLDRRHPRERRPGAALGRDPGASPPAASRRVERRAARPICRT